jgi:site-specific DNA-methyltransferase (adenine-specific)
MQIYNNDCFNVFPKIKDKVDMVLVDLPYAQTACKWDCMIDLKQMWIELKKICKRDCVYVFFCTTKFGYKLIQSNERWFRYDLVWEKSRKVGFLSANKMPLRKHEMVYVFKEKQGVYNPQKTEGKPYKITGNGEEVGIYLKFKRTDYENKGDRHPTSILPYKKAEIYQVVKEKLSIDNKGDRHPTTIVKFNNPKKSLHRTQKPVELCEWLIKSYSNEADTVLDFTMGSGTTGIACHNTNRKFIGVEKDKEIFDIACKRLGILDTDD